MAQLVGKNVSIEVKDGQAVITVDLSARHGRSASGKTEIVATTSGNTLIEGTQVCLGLNAYVKK
jgi:hypothetical protein